MASKDSDISDLKKQEEVDDITTCCICTEVYTDPKALPCIHTFCMKCIEKIGLSTKKGPGDEMPCPICRRLFKIPPEGFPGLPKHFFIERLIQVSQVSDQSTPKRVLCSLCLEDNMDGDGKETPTASTYCVDCKQKLCDECCSEHRIFKATKNHKLMPISEYESGQIMTTDMASTVCEVQEQKVLDVYCIDCKVVVGPICFIEEHKHHDGSHVDKCVDGFRKQIQNNTDEINQCISAAQNKQTELTTVKEKIQLKLEGLECDVGKRKDEIIQLTDDHASRLLQVVYTERQSRFKEIQMSKDDVDAYLSNLDSYNSYCRGILAKGSASDICRALSDLTIRAFELQQECQPIIERLIPDFQFCLRHSELEAFLEEECGNLVGIIEEEGDLKQRKRNKELLVEHKNEIDIFKHENDKLKQELSAEKTSGSRPTLQTNIDKLKQELSDEKTNGSTLQAEIDKLKQELKAEKATHTKNAQESNLLKTTVKTLESNAEKLRKDLETMKGAHRLVSDPVFAQMVDMKELEWIRGMAILDRELFVVGSNSSEVNIYDTITFKFSRQWNLAEMTDATDIASCKRNKCLYIFDGKSSTQTGEILRVDPDGNCIKNWKTDERINRRVNTLSVTEESNVILTHPEKNSFCEYSPDGQLISEINLSPVGGICYPSFAIKLSSGHFVVSHGKFDESPQRVSIGIMDANGQLKKSYDGVSGKAYGHLENQVSVDGNGSFMVLDELNNRILMLDSDLKFKREIISKEISPKMNYPTKFILDESNGLLFVADNDSSNRKILLFAYKY